jgi:hypothetical protein
MALEITYDTKLLMKMSIGIGVVAFQFIFIHILMYIDSIVT